MILIAITVPFINLIAFAFHIIAYFVMLAFSACSSSRQGFDKLGERNPPGGSVFAASAPSNSRMHSLTKSEKQDLKKEESAGLTATKRQVRPFDV